MPLFRTNLFSLDPPGEAFSSRGAAWTFEKASGVYTGPPNKMHLRSEQLRRERGFAPCSSHSAANKASFFDMEIQILAAGASKAHQALNLLVSSLAVVDGSITFVPEPFADIREVGVPAIGDRISRYGVIDACKLANRASRRRSFAYAVHKLALSYRSCSPHIMDLDPNEEPRLFGVEFDPIRHVYLANAVTLAYSAIEELEVEIKARPDLQSKLPDGTWNPPVREDVESRLRKRGIDLTEPVIWTVRGPKTRIENGRALEVIGKPSWARGSVRDRNIQMIDALGVASWLRSKITTHRFSSRTRSLTVYDAHNVQALARRLILESAGFWKMTG